MSRIGLFVLALGAGVAWGAGPQLTLEAVLATAEAAHPDLDLARARLEAAQAEVQAANSLNDFRVTLDASLRGGRNDLYRDRYQPDHFLRINARKTLWDAGRQEAVGLVGGQEGEARGLQLMDVRAQRRLSLMARYFDVLLADMREAAETEFLAVAYVAWDHAKDRQALGQMAAWELAELENRYMDARSRRNDARRQLREKRMQLAAAMNRPGSVLEDLVDPKLAGNDRAPPEFETLLSQVLAGNPRLQAQGRLLAAARGRLDAARAEYRPSLEFEAEAAAWSRDSVNRDDLRAGLNFVWPIWQGGRVDARIGREQARFHELQAEYDKLVTELRQAVLEAREEIEYLRDSERRGMAVNAAYRDLALERARAEYELELKAHLGSSMAETQVARLRQRAVEYRLALAWTRLEALLGGPEALTRLVAAAKQEEKK